MDLFSEEYLAHHGILGQKWGVRRYQNTDGSLTSAGRERYNGSSGQRKAGLTYITPALSDPWQIRPVITKRGYEKSAERHNRLVSKFEAKSENAKTEKRAAKYAERAKREGERSKSYKAAADYNDGNKLSTLLRRGYVFSQATWNENVTNIVTHENMKRGEMATRRAVMYTIPQMQARMAASGS